VTETRAVLITGASSGIGRSLAAYYCTHGCRVAGIARRESRLKDLEQELSGNPGEFRGFPCDVTCPDSVFAAAQKARRLLGPIDTLVANAGFGVYGKFQKLALTDFERQFETNFFGVLHTIRAVLPDLTQTKGRLVIIGSISGYVAVPESGAYTMSKYALRALCETLRYELSPAISVTHIAPGLVDTEFVHVDNLGRYHGDALIPQGSHPPDLRSRGLRSYAMPPEKAAKKIHRAIEKRKREYVLPLHGKILARLSRHFPDFLFFLFRIFKITAHPKPDMP
jgi:short-subunit dehydrogenase